MVQLSGSSELQRVPDTDVMPISHSSARALYAVLLL